MLQNVRIAGKRKHIQEDDLEEVYQEPTLDEEKEI